ncbi:uncharacterized protein V6R79_006976 [Siganus canaliculatus]
MALHDGDLYQYPVHFECRGMRREQIRKIENYFRIRRKSGGGECGPLRREGEHLYSVAFKDQGDQQKVLRKPEHVVGDLVLTVRESLEPFSLCHVREDSVPVQPVPASPPPPAYDEYEPSLNSYVLQYLKDCPEAEQELKGVLESLSCYSELEDRGISVRRLVQPGLENDVTNWKAEVDQVFDSYLCYEEEDPERIEALCESCSSAQTPDEVKVYREEGRAVVVGKHFEVNARLSDVDDRLRLSEKKTSHVDDEPLVEVTGLRATYKSLSVSHRFQSLSLSDAATAVASYSLHDGLQVSVCRGDITKQEVDALVNAASEDLNHCGGLAAALSQAGGPEIQLESSTLVNNIGKIPAGDVVLTTGGNLKCKKLLHAVGPVGGRDDGSERVLLRKAVSSALNLCEIMEFQSVAIPCISSGVSGFPAAVCAQAIVSAVREFGSEGGRSLRRVILIDNRGEVVSALQEACDRLLQGASAGRSVPSDWGSQSDTSVQDDAAAGVAARVPEDNVCVKIIQGTIEDQQVEALVSPMVGHDPCSTKIGLTLSSKVGPQLKARFRKETTEGSMPGDAVMIEGLPGLPSDAIFFLNLAHWDGDENGVAAEVLKLGISSILEACEKRGFTSVAFPVLGAGVVLNFPSSIVARILLEEVQKFRQYRGRGTSLLVNIVIHPKDNESREAFNDAIQASTTKRIVLLGKTGSGKSNLANTIFGEELFSTNHTPNSGTSQCQAETRSINGRNVTLIDTPGFFDAVKSEEELKPEVVRCLTECAPGPHAFLIVLKVEKFTKQEQDVITKICQYFSEDALKYAVIVFTHGDQLPPGMTIEEFVSKNKKLSELVQKCGGRCHVIDNKYWENNEEDEYRNNRVQVEKLLHTIDKMVMENNGGCYTNKMLQEIEREIQEKAEDIRQKCGDLTPEQIKTQAKAEVHSKFLVTLAGVGTGALLGAFFGLAAMVGVVITAVRNVAVMKVLARLSPAAAGAAGGGAAGAAVLPSAGVVAGVGAAGVMAVGGVIGAVIGHEAAAGAETPWEAAEMAAGAIVNKGKDALKRFGSFSP